jgi:preprotein translocase subunit SecG
MYTLVVTVHIVACVILVLSVLLQQGKGAEVGAVFGSSEAVFGSSGPASLLSKITTAVAIVFMVTSLSLTYLAAHHEGGSVMKDVAPVSAPAASPAIPAPPQVDNKELPAGHLSVNVEPSSSVGQKGADSSGETGAAATPSGGKQQDDTGKSGETAASE